MTASLDLIHCQELGTFVCVRTGTLGILFLILATAALIQAVRTSLVPTARLRFQLGILCIAAAESIIGAVHYLAYSSTVFRFVLMYFQLVAASMVTYHFARLALRVSRARRYINWALKPALAIALVYFTVILGVACLGNTHKSETGCDDPAWLTFSTSGFVLAVTFCGAAWAIQRGFRHTRMSKNLGRDSRRWKIVALAAVNLVSFTVQFLIDLWTTFNDRCGSIYMDPGASRTFLYISSRIVFLMLPIATILLTFRDIPSGRSDEALPAHSVGRGAGAHIAAMATAPLVVSEAMDTTHQGHSRSLYATGGSSSGGGSYTYSVGPGSVSTLGGGGAGSFGLSMASLNNPGNGPGYISNPDAVEPYEPPVP